MAQEKPSHSINLSDLVASEADIRRAEKLFAQFFTCIVIVAVLLASSLLLFHGHSFWEGNRLWTIGAFFIFVSVIHARYFDIKKNAASLNEGINKDLLNKTLKTLEKAINDAWIVGFLLIVLSRWI